MKTRFLYKAKGEFFYITEQAEKLVQFVIDNKILQERNYIYKEGSEEERIFNYNMSALCAPLSSGGTPVLGIFRLSFTPPEGDVKIFNTICTNNEYIEFSKLEAHIKTSHEIAALKECHSLREDFCKKVEQGNIDYEFPRPTHAPTIKEVIYE